MLGRNIRRALALLKVGLNQDTESSREMLKTYYSFTQGNTTQEGLAKANKQLNIVLMVLGFVVLTVLPFFPITIPLIAKFERKYDIDIVPDWFKDSLNK